MYKTIDSWSTSLSFGILTGAPQELRSDGSRRAVVTTSGTIGSYGSAMHRMYITAIRYADGTVDTGAVTQCGLAPVSIVPDSARVGVARAVDCRRCNPPDPPFPVIPWPPPDESQR